MLYNIALRTFILHYHFLVLTPFSHLTHVPSLITPFHTKPFPTAEIFLQRMHTSEMDEKYSDRNETTVCCKGIASISRNLKTITLSENSPTNLVRHVHHLWSSIISNFIQIQHSVTSILNKNNDNNTISLGHDVYLFCGLFN